MTLLIRVLAYLEERGAISALIGAMALPVHGVARATSDRDLLLTDRRVLDAQFWKDWNGDQAPEIRVGDAEDPLAGVVAIQGEGAAVDLVVWTRGLDGARHRASDLRVYAGGRNPRG